MARYIELIDKYRIEQGMEDHYNPPNYIWTDNTGEIVRCRDCEWWIAEPGECCKHHGMWFGDDYCSKGEKRHGSNS